MSAYDKLQQIKNKMKEKQKQKENGNEEEKKASETEEARDYLASASRDKTIRIWEVKNSRCVITLIGHDNWVTDLVFHGNGKFLLSSSDDMSIRIWDLTNGRQYRKLEKAHTSFVTSIDMKGKTVVTGSVDKALKVWACR